MVYRKKWFKEYLIYSRKKRTMYLNSFKILFQMCEMRKNYFIILVTICMKEGIKDI